ncbi:MAG: aminoglycoside 6-adenylyltransferase [Tissierellia bacterium]|nr:aminoglycoside 6-adenylyltransferase [Tissierellia bacterium]
MEKRDQIIEKLIHFGQDHQDIESLLQTGERNNPNGKKDHLMDYQFVFGVKDPSEFQDPHFLEEIFGQSLLMQKQDGLLFVNKVTKDHVGYTLILDDITKITISFLPQDQMQEYIQMDSLSKILINKDDLLVGNNNQTDISYRQLRPTKKEFNHCCNQFFIEALNVAKGLYRGEIIYAIKTFSEIRETVDQMTSFYIGAHYDFKVSIGERYKYIKNYLEPEHYQRYLETYPLPDRDYLWRALFNACMLFRKEGLEVARILNYEYPKLADREIIQNIRNIYSKYNES